LEISEQKGTKNMPAVSSLDWQPPIEGAPAVGTHDYLAIVRVPGDRGFSAKVYGEGNRWLWAAWRQARTSSEESVGLKMGKAASKLKAVAAAEAALAQMRRVVGL
jgi:hypothetical protein